LADEHPDRVRDLAARWEALTAQFARDAATGGDAAAPNPPPRKAKSPAKSKAKAQ
jgi:hypothetical protein